MNGLLSLLEIRKAYGDTRVLEGMTLSLALGEVISLPSPSGCGKSTLLRIVAGLDNNFQGTIEHNPTFGFGPDGENSRSGGIGVVFQEPCLLPWLTVAQNVDFTDGWLGDKHWVKCLLVDVGLAGCGGLLPKQLSSGMAQHAVIARGLYGRPQVLLLDEPFSAVDAFTRTRLQDLLQDVVQNYEISTLLVAHDFDEAFYLADRVPLMDGRSGRIRRKFHVPLVRPRDHRAVELTYLRDEALTKIQRTHVLWDKTSSQVLICFME